MLRVVRWGKWSGDVRRVRWYLGLFGDNIVPGLCFGKVAKVKTFHLDPIVVCCFRKPVPDEICG